MRVLTVSRQQGAKQTNLYAALIEDDHRMGILRGVQMTAPARAFEWNFKAETATVAPPAPFTGTATFTRLSAGLRTFTGTLRVPVLGEGPVRMAGRGFNARLRRGVPNSP